MNAYNGYVTVLKRNHMKLKLKENELVKILKILIKFSKIKEIKTKLIKTLLIDTKLYKKKHQYILFFYSFCSFSLKNTKISLLFLPNTWIFFILIV